MNDVNFRKISYMACVLIYNINKPLINLNEFLMLFAKQYMENITEVNVMHMKHAIQVIENR